MTLAPPNRETYTARFDGKEYLVKGSYS
jgi:hypothetical protein